MTFKASKIKNKMEFIKSIFGLHDPEEPRKSNILLIIDPQIDFHPGGSLAVAGANEDSERTASLITNHIAEIDEIYVTLDSHHRNHIAHAIFWKNAQGEAPPNFTLITHDDIRSKKWVPRNVNLLDHALNYTRSLEDQGKYILCIWPEHCLIGSPGHGVVPVLNAALQNWVGVTGKSVHYVHKGENCLTEMYSAIKADYEIENDPRTQRDPELAAALRNTSRLLVCGQALSHCVNFTFMDILETWPKAEHAHMVLLTDASSPVGGFEAQGIAFKEAIQAAGCTLATTATVFPTHHHDTHAAGTHEDVTGAGHTAEPVVASDTVIPVEVVHAVVATDNEKSK